MQLVTLLGCLVLATAAAALRLWLIIPGRTPGKKVARRRNACRTLIVLGSGGHTAEMMQLIKALDAHRYTPRYYVIAESDTLSESAAKRAERDRSSSSSSYSIYRIPRARDVGQSWGSVPVTVTLALMASTKVVWQTMPDLILCNGPGSCVPICMAAYLLKFLGIRSVQIVYVESFARVQTLSLSGKILYLFADRFLVQWPELAKLYNPKAEYHGMLV